jgi:hypothetical protein
MRKGKTFLYDNRILVPIWVFYLLQIPTGYFLRLLKLKEALQFVMPHDFMVFYLPHSLNIHQNNP